MGEKSVSTFGLLCIFSTPLPSVIQGIVHIYFLNFFTNVGIIKLIVCLLRGRNYSPISEISRKGDWKRASARVALHLRWDSKNAKEVGVIFSNGQVLAF